MFFFVDVKRDICIRYFKSSNISEKSWSRILYLLKIVGIPWPSTWTGPTSLIFTRIIAIADNPLNFITIWSHEVLEPEAFLHIPFQYLIYRHEHIKNFCTSQLNANDYLDDIFYKTYNHYITFYYWNSHIIKTDGKWIVRIC